MDLSRVTCFFKRAQQGIVRAHSEKINKSNVWTKLLLRNPKPSEDGKSTHVYIVMTPVKDLQPDQVGLLRSSNAVAVRFSIQKEWKTGDFQHLNIKGDLPLIINQSA